MIVAMAPGAAEEEIQAVIAHLVELGFDVHRETGAERTVLACLGAGDAVRARLDPDAIAALPGVASALRISAPYKLAARAFRPQGTQVTVGAIHIGDGSFALLDPSAFTPVAGESELAALSPTAAALTLTGGSMYNRTLLRLLGQRATAVALERAPGATLEEWLLAAEAILAAGNFQVLLRLPSTPRTPMDIAAIPELHRLTHLPVLADASTAPIALIAPLARAAVAADADALLLRPADAAVLAPALRQIHALARPLVR